MGSLIDMSGKQYNDFYVIERDNSRKTPVYWICKCKCGNIISVSGTDLRSGKRKKCKDCLTKDKWIHKPGCRIGPNKILILDRKVNDLKATFECPECRKPFYAFLNGITSGNIKRCPECSKKFKQNHLKKFQKDRMTDLTNQRSGLLTAIYRLEDERGADGSRVWYCKCDCGGSKKVSVNDFGRKVFSCGCLNTSIGELEIQKILDNLKINYQKQYKFNDCINPETNRFLRFDFYLPDYNCCIEYDGRQHFSYDTNWKQTKEEFEQGRYRDSLKEQYCKNHNIKLIRIPYTDFGKINKQYIKEKLVA